MGATFYVFPKVKQQKIALFTSFYYCQRVCSKKRYTFDSVVINRLLIYKVLLHIYHKIANLEENIKKNC